MVLAVIPRLWSNEMLNQLQDVFASFQKHEVRYLVIGGIAAVLYGVPRATFDLDILIEATPENARRLLEAMLEAKLGTAALTSAAICCPRDHHFQRPGAHRRPDLHPRTILRRSLAEA